MTVTKGQIIQALMEARDTIRAEEKEYGRTIPREYSHEQRSEVAKIYRAQASELSSIIRRVMAEREDGVD